MTFRSESGRVMDEAGVKAEAAKRSVAGWEDDDEWEQVGYEMEDEVELTEEEENWGEDLDEDVENDRSEQQEVNMDGLTKIDLYRETVTPLLASSKQIICCEWSTRVRLFIHSQ